jgi:hypothetical protein
MRSVTAAAFVAGMAAALYAVPESWTERHDAAWVIGLLILYFACGALVGRWWALALAFLPVALALPAGTRSDADGTPPWWWVLLDTAVIFVWAMLAGALAGWAARGWQHSRRRSVG